jgi:hypothetical protein
MPIKYERFADWWKNIALDCPNRSKIQQEYYSKCADKTTDKYPDAFCSIDDCPLNGGKE